MHIPTQRCVNQGAPFFIPFFYTLLLQGRNWEEIIKKASGSKGSVSTDLARQLEEDIQKQNDILQAAQGIFKSKGWREAKRKYDTKMLEELEKKSKSHYKRQLSKVKQILEKNKEQERARNEQYKKKLQAYLSTFDKETEDLKHPQGAKVRTHKSADPGQAKHLAGFKTTVEDLVKKQEEQSDITKRIVDKMHERKALERAKQPLVYLPPLVHLYYLKDFTSAIPEKINTLVSEEEKLKIELYKGTKIDIPRQLQLTVASIGTLLPKVQGLADLLTFWIDNDDFAKLTEKLFVEVKQLSTELTQLNEKTKSAFDLAGGDYGDGGAKKRLRSSYQQAFGEAVQDLANIVKDLEEKPRDKESPKPKARKPAKRKKRDTPNAYASNVGKIANAFADLFRKIPAPLPLQFPPLPLPQIPPLPLPQIPPLQLPQIPVFPPLPTLKILLPPPPTWFNLF